jgi:hypothetical protein
LEKIGLQLGLSVKLSTESGALFTVFRNITPWIRVSSPPAIRTPPRRDWSSVAAVNILGVVAKGYGGGELRLNGDHRALTESAAR